jgi:hypothetical protein
MEAVMARKSITFLSIFSFLNFTTGCTTTSMITVPRDGVTALQADTVAEYPRKKIVQATLVDGTVVVYNDDGGRYRNRSRGQDSVVVGVTDAGTVVVTPLKDVESVTVEETEPRKTDPMPSTFLGWTLVVAAVAAMISLVIVVSNLPTYMSSGGN